MNDSSVTVSESDLIGEVKRFRDGGWRMVHITALRVADNFELIYGFDKNYEYSSLRVICPCDEQGISTVHVPSTVLACKRSLLRDLIKISFVIYIDANNF